jgi:hypothetical protein
MEKKCSMQKMFTMKPPMESETKSRRETIRRKLRKKRVKFREKLKERKALQRNELQEERQVNLSNNEFKFKKKSPDKPKEELSKRSIRRSANKLYELAVVEGRDQ